MAEPLPHGGDIEAWARAWHCGVDEILDLSTGIHPLGPPSWLAAWLRDHAGLAAIYPDLDGEPARSALAEAFGVGPESVVITAGAQAAIEVLFPAFGWRSMAIRVPCYREPLRCAERAGCRVCACDGNGAMPEAELRWMTTPDNPGGEAVALEVDGCWQVWDESYMPFAERSRLGVSERVIRVGSLTKLFAIPGLRLGYVVAAAATIARLRDFLPPWPAATPALHLLPELLLEAVARDRAVTVARSRLVALLKEAGWRVRPSAASFVLAHPEDGVAPEFARHRILVRDFPEWPQLRGWFRFGLPGDEVAWRRLSGALGL